MDEGKLPRQPVRQRMQVEYTANVKPLSQDEQRLVARWTQGDDKEDITTAPTGRYSLLPCELEAVLRGTGERLRLTLSYRV